MKNNKIEFVGGYKCYFTMKKAKAFMLLHVFYHELGHHYDRITSKGQAWCKRGENFAENFAFEMMAKVKEKYYVQF